jgi:hypothetical protein
MTVTRAVVFDGQALYDALDQQRRSRGMTWQEVARTVGVSASAMTAVARRERLEADGVLAMVRWLGRTPESFTGDPGDKAGSAPAGDALTSQRFLRVDTTALHRGLDERRRSLDLTWRQVAQQIGNVTPSMLSRLAMGGRTEVNVLLAATAWLGSSVDRFTHLTDR